MSKKVWEGKGT